MEGGLGRWRRIDLARARLVEAILTPDGGVEVEDELVFLLHAFYDVWDPYIKSQVRDRAPTTEQDAVVQGDPAGETAAALAHRRGLMTHEALISRAPARARLWGEGVYGEGFYGANWQWEPHSCDNDAFKTRDRWSEAHLTGQLVNSTCDAAIAWLRERTGPVTT